MNLADHPLLERFVGMPAVVDSNLLLLNWCHRFDESLIRLFKRLSSFESRDAYFLTETLRLFSSLSTTPHVLTEVSNLASALPFWRKEPWSEFLAKEIGLVPEIFEPSSEVALDVAAFKFGITDAALARIATDHVILTVDWPLANFLESRGLLVINFDHLREEIRKP